MLTFLGDLFWDTEKSISIDSSIKKILSDSSLVCCNFEGGIGSMPEDFKVGSRLNFRSDIPKLLTEIGIDTINVANNHALDAGYEGLQNLSICEASGIDYFGTANCNYYLVSVLYRCRCRRSYWAPPAHFPRK